MRHLLYTEADAVRLEKKRKRCLYTALAVAAITVGTVAVLLARTNAHNEYVMRYAAEAAAVLFGCAGVLLLMRATSLKRSEKHVHVMLKGPADELKGVLSAPGKPQRIPGGTEFRPVTLRTEKGTRELRVSPDNAAKLPADGTRVRVRSAHGFLTAWEEEA